MGAYCNDDLNMPVYSAGAPTNELRFSKHVYDNVHGNIYLDPVTLLFSLSSFFRRSKLFVYEIRSRLRDFIRYALSLC